MKIDVVKSELREIRRRTDAEEGECWIKLFIKVTFHKKNFFFSKRNFHSILENVRVAYRRRYTAHGMSSRHTLNISNSYQTC